MSARVPGWAPAVLAVMAVGIFLTLTRGVDLRDESWSLQVVDRVLQGDVLYRDVYWVATPLSVWLPVAAGMFFGSGMLLLKALMVAVLAGTVLLTWRVARQAGATTKGATLAAVGVVVYAGPATHPQYTALAAMLCLASLSALLTWLSREGQPAGGSSGRALLLAGVMAGLSFSSKQTIGAGALAAVVLTVAAQPSMAGGWRRKLADVGLAAGGALGAVAIVLAPVAATGALGDFLHFAFGAGERFRLTEVSYLDGLRESLEVGSASDPLAAYRIVTEAPVFILPVLALAALAITLLRGRRWWRPALAVVALFAVVALASAFPQFNARLVSRVAPFMLVVLACAAPALPLGPRVRRILFGCAAAWLALVLAATLGKPLNSLRNGDYRFSSLPHFEGALMGQERLGVEANVARLKAAAPKRTVMVSVDGSFYSLVSGRRNPTRYDDFQGLTTLGEYGTREVVRAIERGKVAAVCVGGTWAERLRLRPAALIAYVEKHLRRGRDLGPCVLYER